MFRRVLIVLIVSLFVAAEVAPAAAQLFGGGQQQEQTTKKKRKTLFDFLFGGDEDEKPPAPPPKVVTKPKKARLPAPTKPTVEKAETATRLAVFGDSLAVDLAAALKRFYEDDPNIVIVNQGVGSSGFVRSDFFDWDKTAVEQVEKNDFDIAVMIIGINDRQNMKVDGNSLKVLTPEWDAAYKQRVSAFVSAIHNASKPLIWVGLPPMSRAELSNALGQISSLQRLAVFAGGADFLDIYDKFVDDDGNYSPSGPDLNGKIVRMRKDDGIHFTTAGADKLAFYLSQSIKLYYRGGGAVGLTVADALAGTDAALMVRPPYQGLGQTRLLEVAGAVIPLTQTPRRATDLVSAATALPRSGEPFDQKQMLEAPEGRVDDFGVGVPPNTPEEKPD
jgi:hypothetical protein